MTERLRFKQGQLFHMTVIERLPAILATGELLCDAALAGSTPPGQQIAHAHLKERRRTEPVPVPPGGFVGDYVPFYLAPRSPMLSANFKGGVPGRTAGEHGIIYLVTEIDRLAAVAPIVITNKHPLRRANFTADLAKFHDPTFIDWEVMFDPWFTSQTDTERPERRQAEVLAHGRVPLSAMLGVAARTDDELAAVRQCLGVQMPEWHLNVRRDWYFG